MNLENKMNILIEIQKMTKIFYVMYDADIKSINTFKIWNKISILKNATAHVLLIGT